MVIDLTRTNRIIEDYRSGFEPVFIKKDVETDADRKKNLKMAFNEKKRKRGFEKNDTN